ncbi:hypothetical protein Tco_1245766 [Tanacetum coccineum]
MRGSTTRFLAQFFPPERTAKLRIDILMSTTSRRISLRSMDSFQGLTPKSPSSWHRSLAPTKEEDGEKSTATDRKGRETTDGVEDKVKSEEEVKEETGEEAEEEEEEGNPEHFDAFPTMNELRYHEWLLKNPRPLWVKAKIRTGDVNKVKFSCMIGQFNKEQAYLDLESPVNIISRLHYNWIMSNRLKPRRKLSNPKKNCNFVGKVRGLKVFIGNFTYECEIMVLEDMTSVIDHYLGSVMFGKPFVEETGLVYNKEEGTIVFERDKEKILYLIRRSLEVLRKFYWTTLEGRSNQLSHVSSPLLSKPGRKAYLLEDKQNPSVGVFDEPGDGVASIKRRRHDFHSDGVRVPMIVSERGRLKEDLESSTWRRRQDYKATASGLKSDAVASISL